MAANIQQQQHLFRLAMLGAWHSQSSQFPVSSSLWQHSLDHSTPAAGDPYLLATALCSFDRYAGAVLSAGCRHGHILRMGP